MKILWFFIEICCKYRIPGDFACNQEVKWSDRTIHMWQVIVSLALWSMVFHLLGLTNALSNQPVWTTSCSRSQSTNMHDQAKCFEWLCMIVNTRNGLHDDIVNQLSWMFFAASRLASNKSSADLSHSIIWCFQVAVFHQRLAWRGRQNIAGMNHKLCTGQANI